MSSSPQDLQRFAEGLERVIERPSTLRPFVCEGSPLACQVFIVGYNPATSMVGDWWRHWDVNYGFRKADWFREYSEQRGKPSKTRSKIAEISAGLAEFRVLEANIDARPSAKKSQYPKPMTAPFDYLIGACKPQVVIAHGVDAVAHLKDWASTGTLIECRHFIYVGKERTKEILAEALQALK